MPHSFLSSLRWTTSLHITTSKPLALILFVPPPPLQLDLPPPSALLHTPLPSPLLVSYPVVKTLWGVCAEQASSDSCDALLGGHWQCCPPALNSLLVFSFPLHNVCLIFEDG